MASAERPNLADVLAAWKRLKDQADYDNEPIYLTPEEMVLLRADTALIEVEKELLGIYSPPAWAQGAMGFIGTPVIVDREKAAAQRARWRHEQ